MNVSNGEVRYTVKQIAQAHAVSESTVRRALADVWAFQSETGRHEWVITQDVNLRLNKWFSDRAWRKAGRYGRT